MAPRAVIDSPKNLTGVEVERLTASKFKRTESRFADLFLVVTFFFVASRLRALWIELTWFCILIWKFSIRLARTRFRISVCVSGFFTFTEVTKGELRFQNWYNSSHACVHYNCGIYDIVCQIVSRINVGLVAYSAQRNVFCPVLEKVFASRWCASGVGVTPNAPTDFNIFMFFSLDRKLDSYLYSFSKN